MLHLPKTLLYDKTGTFKFAILTSPLFVVGLVIKLYASALFASAYLTTLFVPFLKYFALTGNDPYTYFFSLGMLGAFPYPQLMLYLMSLPGLIFIPLLSSGIFSIAPGDLLLYRLPLLCADIIILLVLSRWLQHHHRALLIFYWCSPILFYITYLHGQLDVLPIALVFLFIHLLFKERWFLSAILLAASIATKFHLVILLPFTFIYLWRHLGFSRQLLGFFATVVVGFLAVNGPQLFSPAFLAMVFGNQEQTKVFDLAISFGGPFLFYVVPAALALLLLHYLRLERHGRDTFVMFLGFAFGILTLFIPPMPGWYFWVVPFFVYFGVKHQRRSLLPLIALTFAYFLHFGLSPKSDYFELFAVIAPSIAALPNPYTLLLNAGFPAAIISNTAFTLLQACLLTNVALIYRYGVEESRRKKLYNAPFLVGIAGDSGSGKTTLARLLTDIFGKRDVATVEGDALHRWERGNEMWKTYTHLDPKANALHEDLEHVIRLRAGEDTFRRHYDHKTGTFTEAERLPSKRLILFEGLHSFYLTSMATLLDLKVFIMPDDTLRTHWKLLRDVGERGYSKERVLEQLAARAKDAADYIASQEPLSDVTFTLKADNVTPATVGTAITLELYLEVRCSNAINVDSLLSELAKQPTLDVEHKFVGRSQLIRLYGSCDAETIEQLSYRLTPELYDMTFHEPGWASGYNGLMQLFLVYYIFASLRLTSHYERTT